MYCSVFGLASIEFKESCTRSTHLKASENVPASASPYKLSIESACLLIQRLPGPAAPTVNFGRTVLFANPGPIGMAIAGPARPVVTGMIGTYSRFGP